MVYIAALVKPTIIPINLFCEAQVALLTSTEISAKYFNFLDAFFSNSAAELLKYTEIHDHFIN